MAGVADGRSSDEWKPEIQCPPDNAPINEDTVRALRDYIRKLEVELLVAPKREMLSSRDTLIESLIESAADKDAEISRLSEEVNDLTDILREAAAKGTVKVEAAGGLLDPSKLFEVEKEQWKNKLIYTIGMSDKKLYLQFDTEHKLIRAVTDTDLQQELHASVVADMPPVK